MIGEQLMKRLDSVQVLICGPSGVGKSTVMQDIYLRIRKLQMIDGSIRTLLPANDEKHYDMMQYDASHIHTRNVQLLNARLKAYKNKENYISDRSFIDVPAYEILNNSASLPQCDIRDIVKLSNLATKDCGITHIVYIPFTTDMFYNWNLENDGKRVTNPYFQMLVSKCFDITLDLMGVSFDWWDNLFRKDKVGRLNIHKEGWQVDMGKDNEVEYTIPILYLKTTDRVKRINIVKEFIQDER